jgi:hypothetical protein
MYMMSFSVFERILSYLDNPVIKPKALPADSTLAIMLLQALYKKNLNTASV